MSDPSAGDGRDDLNGDIKRSDRPWQFTAQRKCDTDGRIEMRAGNGSEHQDNDGKDRARRQRIAQQSQCDITAR